MKMRSTIRGLGILIVAQILAMGITFLLNSFLAINLAPENYGKFSLILSIVGVLAIFLNFGYFSSIGVLVGEEDNKQKQQELLGGIICILFAMGGLTLLLILIFGSFIDDIFDSNIAFIFYSLWFVIVFFPAKDLITQFAKGLGNPGLIAFSRVFIPVVFALITALFFLTDKLNLFTTSLAQFSSIGLLFLCFVTVYKPKFSNLGENLKVIHKKNIDYGSRIYVASVAANAWPELIVFIIPLYGTLSDVAFYKISLMIISPLVLIGQNISLFLFRGFIGERAIDKKIIFYNAIFAISAGVFFVLISEYVVDIIFGSQYKNVVLLSQIMVLGAVINGIYQIPDSYMNANSNGNEVLKSSVFMGITAVASSGILIPKYGLTGAGFAYVLSNLTYALAISYYYLKVTAREV